MPENSEAALPSNNGGAFSDPIIMGEPKPPDVAGIAPAAVAAGSPDTVIIVTGTNFDSTCKGLVNGLARYTQYVSSVSLRITVLAADLANPGSLQIAVQNNVGTSNSVPLTVQ